MKKINIAQALRNEEYLNSLSAEERALIPDNAAGALMLDDEALKAVEGGTETLHTTPACSCMPPGMECF